jgi:glycosyltransferase involved in cell wall biosynthesis
MQRRIGIDVTAAVSQGGGIGRYTREIIQALAKVDSENEYHLYSAKRPKETPIPDPLPTGPNFSYHEAPLSERWLYRIWYRLNLPIPVQWITGSLDLLHSPDFVLPPLRDNIPSLLTIHDLSFVHFPETFTDSLVSYLNNVVPRSIEAASHILADSESTKNDLLAIWGVAPEKISVLYSGVNSLFRPVTDDHVQETTRQKYGIGDKPYLLTVGTVQPRKNYQLLVRAFKTISQSHSHNLVVVGAMGWLHEQLLEEIEKQGLSNRVVLTGFVDDSDLPSLYSGATLFLFPSLYEGFGLPILEAMACGVPVIASNVSSLPEVAGEAAVLLSPIDEVGWADKMHQLLADASLRTRLVAAGFIQAQEFTWKNSAAQLLAIYKQLLDMS